MMNDIAAEESPLRKQGDPGGRVAWRPLFAAMQRASAQAVLWYRRLACKATKEKQDGSRRGSRQIRHRRAFTLLEVLLALTLGLGLMAAATGFYYRAANVRTAVMQETQRVWSQRTVMDRLTNEIRGATIFPFLGMAMEGQESAVRYVTAALPDRSAWTMHNVMQPPPPPQYDLQIVGYRLRVSTDEQGNILKDSEGNVLVVGLERTCQKYISASAEEGQDISVALISSDIKFLGLRYWDGSAWVASWGGGDLPLAVEISLGQRSLPEGMTADQYPYEASRRVVFVPGGTKALQAAASQPAEGATP